MDISYGYNNIYTVVDWNNTLYITGLAASMAVNTLVTGMIVFRILKVSRVKPITSVERTLEPSTGSTSTTKFRHIMFILIESGMALFSIQLVRIVLLVIRVPVNSEAFPNWGVAYEIVTAINQMLNVIIIRSVHFYFFCFADKFYLARALHQR